MTSRIPSVSDKSVRSEPAYRRIATLLRAAQQAAQGGPGPTPFEYRHRAAQVASGLSIHLSIVEKSSHQCLWFKYYGQKPMVLFTVTPSLCEEFNVTIHSGRNVDPAFFYEMLSQEVEY